MPAPLIPGGPNMYFDEGMIYGGYHEPSKEEFADVIRRPRHRGLVVKWFDSARNLRWRCTTNCQFSPILDCEFELTYKGCGSFTLELLWQPKLMPDVCFAHGSWLEFYLWGSKSPIFAGIINRKPGDGSTERTIKVRGIGFIDFVRRELMHDAQDRIVFKLQNTTVWAGVATFVQALESISFVKYNPSKILNDAIHGYQSQTLTENVYIGTHFDVALDELAQLEGGWIWGVDADRDVFFRPPAPCINATRFLYQGHHFQEWKPQEDSSKILNYALVQNGATVVDQTAFASNRFGTNILLGHLEDATSRATYGNHTKIVRAPNVYSDLDANRYAAVEIDQNKNPKIRGYAAEVLYEGNDFVPGECYQVQLRNGNSVTTPLVRARYKMAEGGRFLCDLNFGDESESLLEWATDLERRRTISEVEQRTQRYAETEARPPL